MTPEQREYTLRALDRYWLNQHLLINQLPLKCHGLPQKELVSEKCSLLLMPEWCGDIAVNKHMLVPCWAAEQAGDNWKDVDWIAVCYWYLNNLAERAFENAYGPVHSYSFRLKEWDARVWEYAWVNRIALFLRKWLARQTEKDEVDLFGSVPEAEIILTHDVDAVSKTSAIRIKQTVINALNAIRALLCGRISVSVRTAKKTVNFLLSQDDYWCFDQIMLLEESAGVKSIFNFYAGKPGNQRDLKMRLLDPSYDIHDVKLKNQLLLLRDKGWSIGLHQSFNAWRDASLMEKEKSNLERIINNSVTVCRQHWLRFSFSDTWGAQQNAGFLLDTTLGFNDRPGFRNSAAIAFHPWDLKKNRPMKITSVPLLFMDSHFFDYNQYSDTDRIEQINKWIREIRKVGGKTTIVWHQRVMSRDYGWGASYESLLSQNFV